MIKVVSIGSPALLRMEERERYAPSSQRLGAGLSLKL